MIIIASSAKLISITKSMIQSEATKSLVLNLLTTGRRILSDSMQNVDPLSRKPKAQERRHPESTEYLVHNWLEGLFAWFQMIILWHDPYQTIFVLSGLFSSFL